MNGLTYIRKRCNISLGELASILGVSRQAISSWENEHKSIPEQRKEQLSEFFGIEAKYFGDISEDDKVVLLKKAMYSWNGLKKEAFLYREDEAHIPDKDKDKIYFVKERELSLDEEYSIFKTIKNNLIDKIDKSIDWADMPDMKLQDHMAAINRGVLLYGRLYELAEEMKKQRPELKMPFYYEVLDVLEAMMLGLCDSPENNLGVTREKGEDQIIGGLDEEWIQSLSENIREHWNRTEDMFKKIRSKHKATKKENKPAPERFTVSEVEAEYAQLFDTDPDFRNHGMMISRIK